MLQWTILTAYIFPVHLCLTEILEPEPTEAEMEKEGNQSDLAEGGYKTKSSAVSLWENKTGLIHPKVF